jgi:hypothetical protein
VQTIERFSSTEYHILLALGQTTINQKVVAIAAETVLVAAEMVAAMAVALAMATMAMVATTWQPWQR